ncbi:MAG TPA: serine hydrolase [Candidatus Angelobacter sp.]|nr:serine hydrolase [Candidatus Angelobacter sp.]
MNQLTQDIQSIVEQVGGTWGIVLEDLNTSETWAINEAELFYAASVIKVPIMAAAFAAFEKGLLSLDDWHTLKKEELVGGSGVLQHMTPGTKLSLYDIITLMIIQSDNTATNILIDKLGVEGIQKTMSDAGMTKSTFFNKLMVVPANRKGSNEITAKDISSLLKSIVNGQLISHYACEKMIEIMKKQQIRNGLPGKWPYESTDVIGEIPKWEIANKTGWVPGIRHDAGVFYVGEKKMIVTVLSKDVDDLKSEETLAEIGECLYKYLKGARIG